MLKTESHQLRRRLVEADQETTQWRMKYEKLLTETRTGGSGGRASNNQLAKPSYSHFTNRQDPAATTTKKLSHASNSSSTLKGSLPSVFDRESGRKFWKWIVIGFSFEAFEKSLACHDCHASASLVE
jgi:hypothetical protein